MSLQTFVLIASLAAFVAAQAPLTVNTPTSVQSCLPVQITWNGGTPPVFVSLIPGGQPGGQIIKDFGSQQGQSLTWNVDQPPNTSITVQIRDSTGVLNYSDKFTVQNGPPNCTPAKSAPGASSPPAGSSSSNPSSSSAPATPGSTSPSTPGSTSPSMPASNSTSKPATTSPSAAAGSTPPASTSTTASNGSASPAASAPNGGSRVIPGFFVVLASALIALLA